MNSFPGQDPSAQQAAGQEELDINEKGTGCSESLAPETRRNITASNKLHFPLDLEQFFAEIHLTLPMCIEGKLLLETPQVIC